MKETREARKERQAQEAWRMVDCLRRAGNLVEPEVAVPNLDEHEWRVDYLLVAPAPLLGKQRIIAIEIQGFGFSHCGRVGWHRDIYKAQGIAANGWLYLPVTWEQVSNGDALESLARCGVRVDAQDCGQTFPAEK